MNVLRTEIEARARASGIALDQGMVERLARHVELVYEANAAFNLTRIAIEDAVELHVLDSLTALGPLDLCPAGPFADLGSGAGFPGIPLSIVSARPVALVESVKKKAAFLERVGVELRLDSTVRPLRAEDLALSDAGRFSAVVARALSALPSLVELASPLLADNGLLIALKGRPDPEELARGAAAARLCGMSERSVTEVVIPGAQASRTLVVYEKVGEATRTLPRRAGMAQRQPLA